MIDIQNCHLRLHLPDFVHERAFSQWGHISSEVLHWFITNEIYCVPKGESSTTSSSRSKQTTAVRQIPD
jgi:hypothetical protein